MTSLLNPLLIRTNILNDMTVPPPALVPFFRSDIKFSFILQNILIPLILLLILAFFLKARYDKKQTQMQTQTQSQPELQQVRPEPNENVYY